MKNLSLFNVSIHKIGSEMYVLERKKLKYRSLGITEFFCEIQNNLRFKSDFNIILEEKQVGFEHDFLHNCSRPQ